MQNEFIDEISGMVFKIQRFSLHDGPGIRTTVFLKGCPLSCDWCCNPESQSFEKDIFFWRRLCVRCGACVKVCPYGAVSAEDYEIDRMLCKSCGACAEVCLLGAKEIAGCRMTVNEVIEIVKRDKVFYNNSGGGVTLCGGEPASQKNFAISLLKALRIEKIHTAMETSACVGSKNLIDIAQFCDLVLFDLKTTNGQKGKEVLKYDVYAAIKSLRNILEADIPVILRYAVIPGFNDSKEDKTAMVALAGSLNLERVNILPFHRLGDGKYVALGQQYDYADVPATEKIKLETLLQEFVKAGVRTNIET